jgi:hypothetical protein
MYSADYVVSLSNPAAGEFVKLAEKYLNKAEQAGLNRFSITAYVGTKAMLVAAGRCAKNLTQSCVNDEFRKIKALDTGGLMGKIDFSGPKNTGGTQVQVVKIDPVKETNTPLTGFVSY